MAYNFIILSYNDSWHFFEIPILSVHQLPKNNFARTLNWLCLIWTGIIVNFMAYSYAFFSSKCLKSKPICIITDLYHFLIRHTYFSLSQNTYPAPPFFHSASGKGKDYCWCLGHFNSWAFKNCYRGGEHLFSHFCLHSRIFQPCRPCYLTFWDKAPKAKGSVPLHPLLSPL